MAESLSADAGAGLKALGVNCTLKKSPETSQHRGLMNRVLEILGSTAWRPRSSGPVDYEIKFGVSSDEGDGDEWPQILEKIKAADILLMGMSIWFGVRTSVCQMVIERLDGTYNERNEVGQYPLYNKVAGVVVTGNEDGAHASAETTLFNMTHLGCVVPPNADTYWVGDAGPGPVLPRGRRPEHPTRSGPARGARTTCSTWRGSCGTTRSRRSGTLSRRWAETPCTPGSDVKSPGAPPQYALRSPGT